MSLTQLGKANYVALETFRKNGTGVITPVWVISKNEKLLARTDRNSWKVKRIRNNSRVRVAESDGRGNPTGAWHEAKARIVDNPAEETRIRKQMAQKYKLMYYLIALMTIFSSPDRIVLEISSV